MEHKFIYKKYIYLWYAFTYSGLAVFLIGIFVFGILNIIQSHYLKIIIPLSCILLFLGVFILCTKCKCPYCNFGNRGSRIYEREYHSLLSLRNIKKDMITCPRCKKSIELK